MTKFISYLRYDDPLKCHTYLKKLAACSRRFVEVCLTFRETPDIKELNGAGRDVTKSSIIENFLTRINDIRKVI